MGEQRCNEGDLVAPLNCDHFNFAAALPRVPSRRLSYITYPAKNIRRNQEPGTAYTSIASSACRSPAIRHGMHARMSRLLITNINLAGSWLWNANARRRNVSAAACTLATFQERPQGNRYFRAISIPPCNDCVVTTTTHRVKFAKTRTETEKRLNTSDCFVIFVFKTVSVSSMRIFKNLRDLLILYKWVNESCKSISNCVLFWGGRFSKICKLY